MTFLLQHRMTRLHRGWHAGEHAGPVLGVSADKVDRHFRPTGERVGIRAHQGVVLATEGHWMNVAFRRMFDPRLTEECQMAGLERGTLGGVPLKCSSKEQPLILVA